MRTISDERQALIAELKQQPGFDAWRGWAHEIRDAYFKKLAKAIFDGAPITPEDLAYKRGYFRAINRMFNEIDFSAKAVADDLANSEVTEVD